MRNVESKFNCPEHESVLRRALAAGARDEGWIDQRDVFYEVATGRLKLRHLGDSAELIAYSRENEPQARPSEYGIARTSSPQELHDVLSRALRVTQTLVKRRHLLLLHHTRIHLDDVEGLGRFVELETVVGEINEQQADGEHSDIVRVLGLEAFERISVGYVDLLAARR